MFITLTYYDVMEAIEKHLKDKNIDSTFIFLESVGG